MLSEGTIDALFVAGGQPMSALEELARAVPIRILPIDGPEAARLHEAYPFFAPASVASGTYRGVPATHTLAIGVQLVVSADVDDETVYGITRALWHEVSRSLLDDGHPLGPAMRLETALHGVAIPLHPGAALYYFDRGMVAGGPI
jgi:TRAP transporter TAXI family solute receptor